MNSRSSDSWKTVAWNGVSLRVPSNWEVSSLATSYVQLDDATMPVLELKWQSVKGHFSHKNYLKKLAQQSKTSPGLNFKEVPTPEQWQEALPSFTVRSFVWQTSQIGGEGVILYCPDCRTASLLQFYQKKGRDDSATQFEVLRSFQDHCEDGIVTWSLFGLSALIPKRFELVDHRFQPGHYRLEFQCRMEHLYLNRWGPADLLIKEGGLLQWFEKSCRELHWCKSATIRQYTYKGCSALYGQSKGSNTTIKNLWARITRRQPNSWIRIWHLSSPNQILGVASLGLNPPDECVLEEICRNYDMA